MGKKERRNKERGKQAEVWLTWTGCCCQTSHLRWCHYLRPTGAVAFFLFFFSSSLSRFLFLLLFFLLLAFPPLLPCPSPSLPLLLSFPPFFFLLSLLFSLFMRNKCPKVVSGRTETKFWVFHGDISQMPSEQHRGVHSGYLQSVIKDTQNESPYLVWVPGKFYSNWRRPHF